MKNNYKLKVSTSNKGSLYILEKILLTLSPNFKTIFLPKKQKRFVLLKSPHVNKKSKEHFQFLRYQRLYFVNFLSSSLIKNFLLIAPNDLNITFITIE